MAANTLMFKIEGATQATQLSGLAGKSYSVGKVTSAGPGLGKWLFLDPAGTAAGKGTVAIKLEGTRQVAQLSKLAGQTFTVGKSPAVIGGTGKWLVLSSGKGAAVAAAGTGAAAAKAASASQMVMMELDGTQQMAQLKAVSGKSFTVMKPPMSAAKAKGWLFLKPASGTAGSQVYALKMNATAAQNATLIGKTFTISKAPIAAGQAGKWIVLTPAAKASAAAPVAAAAATAPVVAAPAAKAAAPAAKAAAPAAKAAVPTKIAAAKAAAAKGAGASGTIWNGSGLSLGLGLGLGAWGPVLLLGAAAVGVGVYGYMNKNAAEEVE
ncbi:MAG: hypothetical protein HQL52_13180 [Magnetococcales bacterium]|nr:hypothetical protein [Magnetococcales bacterium]